MHACAGVHTRMDGCAFTLHAYVNVKHGFANTNIFSALTSHRPRYIIPQWSSIAFMLKNIRENVFRTTPFAFALFSDFSLSTSWCQNQFQPLSVWEGSDRLKSMDVRLEISLQGIMRHRRCYDYSAMLLLPAHVIMEGAEGHRVRSFSARCNQSPASSWYKNKQLDFQRIIWDLFFFSVCAGVLMCA